METLEPREQLQRLSSARESKIKRRPETMKRKWLILGAAGALLLTLIPIVLLMAGIIKTPVDQSDPTPVAKITEPTGIRIDGTQRDGSTFYASLPNIDESFDFSDKIAVAENAVWLLSTNPEGNGILESKIVPLTVGDNYFYIGVVNGDKSKVYTVLLRRRPVFSVTFNSRGGSEVASEIIEEGFSAIKPDNPALLGYDFSCWHRDGEPYNFDLPVYSDLNLIAKWEPKVFTVTYESSVGETEILKEQVSYNSWFVPPVPGDTDKFEFFGWYCGDERVEETVYDFVTDITLTAKWISKEYEIKDGVVLGFREGATDKTRVEIPAENGIEEVLAIAPRAFYYCHEIEELYLPRSVVSVGEEAFYGCGALKKVDVEEGSSLYVCGKSAFAKTLWLTERQSEVVYLGKCLIYAEKSLRELVVSEGTLGLADNLFEGAEIESITLPDGLKRIGNHCFEDSLLRTVNLPESLEILGEYAFYGAEELLSATMFSPDEVGAYVFYGCGKLTLTIRGKPKDLWNPLWIPSCRIIYE